MFARLALRFCFRYLSALRVVYGNKKSSAGNFVLYEFFISIHDRSITAVAVQTILAHLGEATSPPRLAKARGPPLREMQNAASGEFDPQAQPEPDYEFDQRVAW